VARDLGEEPVGEGYSLILGRVDGKMINAGLVLWGVALVCAMLEAPGIALGFIIAAVVLFNQV